MDTIQEIEEIIEQSISRNYPKMGIYYYSMESENYRTSVDLKWELFNNLCELPDYEYFLDNIHSKRLSINFYEKEYFLNSFEDDMERIGVPIFYKHCHNIALETNNELSIREIRTNLIKTSRLYSSYYSVYPKTCLGTEARRVTPEVVYYITDNNIPIIIIIKYGGINVNILFLEEIIITGKIDSIISECLLEKLSSEGAIPLINYIKDFLPKVINQKIDNLNEEISNYLRNAEIMKEDVKNHEEGLINAENLFKDSGKISPKTYESVYITPDKIIANTGKIMVSGEGEDEDYLEVEFDNFEINIPINDVFINNDIDSIKVFGGTRPINDDYNEIHPHIMSDGSTPCFGGWIYHLEKAAKNFDVQLLLQILYNYLGDYSMVGGPHLKLEEWTEEYASNKYDNCYENDCNIMDCNDDNCPYFENAIECCSENADTSDCQECVQQCSASEDIFQDCFDNLDGATYIECFYCSKDKCQYCENEPYDRCMDMKNGDYEYCEEECNCLTYCPVFELIEKEEEEEVVYADENQQEIPL